MNSSKFWLAVLVGGVVANILDYVVWNFWLGPSYIMANTELFRQDVNPMWWIVGDFVAVFVFVWIYDKVSGSFGSSIQDGAKAGLYFGVFMAFPTWIFVYLMFNNFPYALAWINIIYTLVWYAIVGAVVTTMMKKSSQAAA